MYAENGGGSTLEWNVYVYRWGREKELVSYNVFNHYGFLGDCVKAAKKYKKTEKSAFAEDVLQSLMYYFWSKCEWEIILMPWPTHDDDEGEKIDVYDQVVMNWEHFINYLWDHKAELRLFKTIAKM